MRVNYDYNFLRYFKFEHCCEGIPLQGRKSNANGNFDQFTKFLAKYFPKLAEWLKKKRRKYSNTCAYTKQGYILSLTTTTFKSTIFTSQK